MKESSLTGSGTGSAVRPNITATESNGHNIDVPVLIVGGGPTGLLTAYLLSKHDVKSLLIEKYPERLAAPKAHALCPRSLEICRQYGIDTNELRKLGAPRSEAFWVNFLTSVDGDAIGRLPYERMDPEVLESTPEMIHNIPQPDFERYIAQRLEHDSNVEVKKGVAFVSCAQQGDQVVTTVENRATKSRWQILSRHVLACDGARSQVRHHLGIETEGEDGHETMMTIHFKADLRTVTQERPGMLHWILDPACSGFIISYDVAGNQVLISNFDSNQYPVDKWTDELARTTVAAAIGKETPFKLLSFRPWVLSRKVAMQFRKDNVFLVGDAAHSFPPTGGLGLNSGLADAHNIAYKIAAVQKGHADPSSLNSYETERRPIALINSAQSVKNGKKIFSFLKAVGTAEINDVEAARENLQKTIHDPSQQDMIAHHVEGQREHFDNLEIHIGYVYPHAVPPCNASEYQPKFVRGARLPHAWIKARCSEKALCQPPIDTSYVHEFSAADVSLRQWSTLDLISPGTFTIIAGQRSAWIGRLAKVQKDLEITGVKVELWSADADFEFTIPQQRHLFEQEAGLAMGGCMLVRPDQHLLGCMSAFTTTAEIVLLIEEEVGRAA